MATVIQRQEKHSWCTVLEMCHKELSWPCPHYWKWWSTAT